MDFPGYRVVRVTLLQFMYIFTQGSVESVLDMSEIRLVLVVPLLESPLSQSIIVHDTHSSRYFCLVDYLAGQALAIQRALLGIPAIAESD